MRATARTGACFTALLVAAAGGCGRSGLGELENGPSTPSTSSSSGSSSGGESGLGGGVGSSSGGSSGSSGSVGPADSGPELDAQQPAPDCGSAAGLVTLASGQTGSRGLAIDSANIYWLLDSSANGGTVRVMRESLCGGPVSTLATVPGNQGSSLVTDGHDVYWAELGWVMGDIQMSPNALFSVPVTGGTVSTIWSSPDTRYLQGLTVDPTGVYGIECPGYGVGTLVRIPLAGGPTTTLASGFYEPEELTIAGTMVYWVDGYAGGMYPKPGAVMAVPIGGGTPVTFAQGGTDPAEIVSTSRNVIWTSGGTDLTGQLYGLVTEPLTGGATTTLVGPTNMPLAAIVADDANVYFAYAIGGPTGLMKVDPTGASPPTTLVPSANASAVAVDSTSVYWTDWYAGTVMKLTPK